MRQMDVVMAFRYGLMTEEVFVEQLKLYIQCQRRELVCKLNRSLYGLKQAPRYWNQEIDTFFCDILKMRIKRADTCIYVSHESSSILLIALYVNVLLIASDSEVIMNETKRELCGRFKIKDLGESKTILDMDID